MVLSKRITEIRQRLQKKTLLAWVMTVLFVIALVVQIGAFIFLSSKLNHVIREHRIVLLGIGAIVFAALLWGGLMNLTLHLYQEYEVLEFRYSMLLANQRLQQTSPCDEATPIRREENNG